MLQLQHSTGPTLTVWRIASDIAESLVQFIELECISLNYTPICQWRRSRGGARGRLPPIKIYLGESIFSHPPSFTWTAKNCTKNAAQIAILRSKMKENYGEGAVPPTQTLPPVARGTPSPNTTPPSAPRSPSQNTLALTAAAICTIYTLGPCAKKAGLLSSVSGYNFHKHSYTLCLQFTAFPVCAYRNRMKSLRWITSLLSAAAWGRLTPMRLACINATCNATLQLSSVN